MKEVAWSSDIIHVREAFRIKAEERLLRDLKRLKAKQETLERWLGHPWDAGLTPYEYDTLSDYVERTEEAIHSGRQKKAGPLPPRLA